MMALSGGRIVVSVAAVAADFYCCVFRCSALSLSLSFKFIRLRGLEFCESKLVSCYLFLSLNSSGLVAPVFGRDFHTTGWVTGWLSCWPKFGFDRAANRLRGELDLYPLSMAY